MLGVEVREHHPSTTPHSCQQVGFLQLGKEFCRQPLWADSYSYLTAGFGAGRTQLTAQNDLVPWERLSRSPRGAPRSLGRGELHCGEPVLQ